MSAPAWAELEALFHEARIRPPAERPALLAERCAGRPELRTQVEAMLRAHDETGSGLSALLIAASGSLTAGARVGTYEIVGPLGADGMGEVYRARDSRLRRDVAVKILPAAFTADADRLARFEREARVLAALNHPNIAAIYGIEEGPAEAGHHVRALILELVEGETLADRIVRGPIPPPEALGIAWQIAEALEAAHEKGIVHRDLKPTNIKLAPNGMVKVLDFGLAKAVSVDGTAPDLALSPTMSAGGTREGVIVGTPAYMSPEQARGQQVDKRTDIWAFACLLYEMLTGRCAFDGDDVMVTLAHVVEREPDFDALPPSVPPRVGQALRVCLRKDPKQRVGDIRDVRLVLEGAFETAPGSAASRGHDPADAQTQIDMAVSAARREATKSARRRLALAGAAAVVGAGAVGGAAVWWTIRPAPASVLRTEVTTAGATALTMNGLDRDLAITPDGSRVVYRGTNQLLVRALDELEPHVLRGLGAPRGVFLSPDGQWVGFFDGDSPLRKVAVTGGPPVTIAPVDGVPRGATWGPDGTIVYATNAPATGLQRVSAAGGAPTVLTTPNRERGEADHLWPEFLPDGRAVLFTIDPSGGGLENSQIAVLDLVTGTSKVVLRGGHHAHYVPTGHLVYGAGSTLRAVAFDRQRLEVVGTPVPVLDLVVTTGPGGVNASVAATGTLVYVRGRGPDQRPGGTRSLVWVDRMGREEPVPAPVRAYENPRLSPDGTRVALEIRDQENDIWIWDFARATLTRVTFDARIDAYPVWLPGGRRLLFTSARSGAFNLYWQAADGIGAVERLTEGTTAQFPHAMTPDGSHVIIKEINRQEDLMLLPLEPPRRPQPLIQTMFAERNAEIAPDGRWLAYESNESGREEVYVRPFPDVGGGRWQVSTGGGRMALWSRDGQELFYASPEGALMGVRVDAGPSWRGSTPAKILDGPYVSGRLGRTYDISRDGRRFLVVKETRRDQSDVPLHIIVVQNWHQELKRLVPRN